MQFTAGGKKPSLFSFFIFYEKSPVEEGFQPGRFGRFVFDGGIMMSLYQLMAGPQANRRLARKAGVVRNLKWVTDLDTGLPVSFSLRVP